jgi:hypothetical protein
MDPTGTSHHHVRAPIGGATAAAPTGMAPIVGVVAIHAKRSMSHITSHRHVMGADHACGFFGVLHLGRRAWPQHLRAPALPTYLGIHIYFEPGIEVRNTHMMMCSRVYAHVTWA